MEFPSPACLGASPQGTTIASPMGMNIVARSLTPIAAVLPFLVAAAPAPASAGPPTDQLRSRVERVSSALEDPGLRGESNAARRLAEIRKVADDIFDFEEMAKRALGRHWEARTPAERDEFVRLFADLLRRTYYGKIERATFAKIMFQGERQQGDDALVRTVVVLPHGDQLDLDYLLLHGAGDRWRVYDLRFEGISLVANYRSQFSRIIRTSSYESLVGRLKSNQAEFATPEDAPRAAR
jgi:phospholipid transport system substrate-binding protein